MKSILVCMHHFVWNWLLRSDALAFITAVIALMTSACATTREIGYRPINTCDASEYPSGSPACLPPPGFFCTTQSRASDNLGDSRYIGQTLSLFPSRESLGPALPVCPPNATALVQEQDAKDARAGAKVIGHTVGRVLTICETIVERMLRHPDNVLAGWNEVQPETVEAVFTKCTSELDSLPAIPAYDDPWLATAAARGFEEGYDAGVDEIMNRLLALELAVATIEVALMGGVELIEVAATRGLRLSLNAAWRMPIFVPGAIGGAGAFLKSAPRVAARVVAEGSSRVLGRNLKLAGLTRLPGEFAHHIVAHEDHRAKGALAVLKKFGIKVDEAVNGIFLPGYKTSPNPAKKIVHGNLHTDAYYRAVENALQGARTQAEVIQRLRIIAWKLEHGIMP